MYIESMRTWARDSALASSEGHSLDTHCTVTFLKIDLSNYYQEMNAMQMDFYDKPRTETVLVCDC